VAPRERFLGVDSYRAGREWARGEGTAQRDLFRVLRARFLGRHRLRAPWVLDVGAGPGRFTPYVGAPGSARIALDLSAQMLREMGRHPASMAEPVDRVRGDALHPPFRPEVFGEVVAFGNVLGFAGRAHGRALSALEGLVAPEGLLLLELAPSPGERSRYLHRLPPTALPRILASPSSLVLARIDREGFEPLPSRHEPQGFARLAIRELIARWAGSGWTPIETLAVAPATGAEPERIEAAWRTPDGRQALIQLEETLGGRVERWPSAAAVLVAARAPPERHP
jgi:SAM-dependent methyltransferase